MRRRFAAVLAAAPLFGQAPASQRNFVACPIVRDTKTTPCWLAEYKGEVYFLGIQSGVAGDFYPPQLSHEVLVEGTVSAGPRVCGGIRLDPVKISVLQEINAACKTMLPAEDGIEAPARAQRGGAPSWLKVDGPGASTLYFDFNSDFLSLHTAGAVSGAVQYFQKNQGARIEVTGYRGSTLLSSGEVLTEEAGIGQARAAKVAVMLSGLGVPTNTVVVTAVAEPARANGVNDPWSRRVVISVTAK